MAPSPMPRTSAALCRWRLTVTGVVQGVGFRPTVYALARQYGVTGFVGNDSGGVFIEIEGPAQTLVAFQDALVANPPPLAHIESVEVAEMAVHNSAEFIIVHSQDQPARNTLISPDICVCDDCLRELFDPADRRYRYPFINCTNCGPRYTIIRDIPYDRPLTTMADFPLCSACQAEYDDPGDRRFHAQPNACPACGPQVTLEVGGETDQANGVTDTVAGDDAIVAAQKMLADGKTVAVKGLGGFHLACDATRDAAVATLRKRKGRIDKPFAVMAADLDAANRVAQLSDAEAALLASKERPIVLLRKRINSPLSDLVAPGNNYIGIMLPYTPLHYLLFAPASSAVHPAPFLVMTSGNYSAEPIIHTNAAARTRLSPLSDALLLHNRAIHTRCDDAVIRTVGNEAPSDVKRTLLPIRRSRGYAPFPVKLPVDLPPTLAVGGELKATFCLAAHGYAYMSQHIGDMQNWETVEAFAQAVDQMQHLFRIQPVRIAHDLHPGYLSTQWARNRDTKPQAASRIPVQHHHAHIAGVMAENGHSGARPVIGVVFDGTGYGTDGTIWGGEVLLADYAGFERVAHLAPTPLPGGDAAIQRPYRVALAQLWAAGMVWDERLPCVAAASAEERRILIRQLETGLNVVQTSSFGRLFDAVAALAGVRQTVSYEAQAAIELESLTDLHETGRYAFGLRMPDDEAGPLQLDAAPVLRAVVEDVLRGVDRGAIAARFHHGVADAVLAVATRVRQTTGYEEVALSGGVWQNVTVLTTTRRLLESAEFTVLTHHLVPPNDGGLALGQTIIAGMRDVG